MLNHSVAQGLSQNLHQDEAVEAQATYGRVLFLEGLKLSAYV